MRIIVRRNPLQSGKSLYLDKYGPHFNKSLCEFAVSNMKVRKSNGEISNLVAEPIGTIMENLKNFGVTVAEDYPYDVRYVVNMAKADFLGSSILDMKGVLLYAKDLLEDPDGYDGIAFNRWLADCEAKLIEIDWDKFI